MLRKLDPSHAELVASKWHFLQSDGNVQWFRELIKKNFSVAAYCDADPSQPVAWILQYSYGTMGHLYTSEDHRRRGLALALTAAMCRQILDDCPGVSPCGCVVERNTAAVEMFEKLGFVYTGIKVYFIS